MFKLSRSKHLNFANIYNQASDLIGQIPLVKKQRRRRRIFKILKYLSLILLSLVLLIIIILAGNFFNLKQIYDQAISGKNNLMQAASALKSEDFKSAAAASQLATSDFSSALSQIDQFKKNWLIKRLNSVKYQLNNIEYLIISAQFLSQAANAGADYGRQLEDLLQANKKLSFSRFTQEEKRKIIGKIYESGPEMAGINADLKLALFNLNQVKINSWLWPLRNKITELKYYLTFGVDLLDQAIPATEILPALAGYPQPAKFLIILQNNNELRPTGGFIGTYGLLEIDSGEIINLSTHDIYHLDMPVKDKLNITPPTPLVKYLGISKWFMRDANWSPDWPTAARQIQWFYNQEAALINPPAKPLEFTGVIGLTPKIITEILALTGPINIDGVEYNQDNFQDLLQYQVEKGYIKLGVSSWQRKEIIGEIAKQLKIKLFDMPVSSWPELLNIINDNIIQKNILIYLSDPSWQNIISQQKLSGQIEKTDGDFLMVVDANMAAFKTDAVMSKNINYQLEQSSNGLFAKVNINYSHHGSFDWKTTRYRTYTRIYVPLGSQLIKAEGLAEGQAEVYNELNKTVFAGFISIEPGKIGSLTFSYKLPKQLEENIKNKNIYNLIIQKQPGNNIGQLTIDFKGLTNVKSYNPTGFNVKKISERQIIWNSDFMTDKEYEINF